ncbi:MAG: extracellular solute-binding protein [Paenibacillaceae bacterium]|nr:extracellular solute-binding protein [Paenibacillaceae bacterium]
MSRYGRKWTNGLLAVTLGMSVVAAGCSSKTEDKGSASASPTAAGSATPVAKKETPTVKFMTAWDPGLPISSDLPVFVEWGKKTGVKFEVNSPPRDSFVEKMNITLASNDLPDMMKFFSDDQSFNRYGPDLFVPLDDYLNSGKLPNLQKWLKKYPDVEKRMRNPDDGKIYGFPFIQDFEFASSLWYVRNDMLKKAGLDASKIGSVDDLKKAFLALKEQTGGPITSTRLGYTYYNWSTQSYFGVGDGIRFDKDKKQYVFSPVDDEKRYKMWVEFERWMYEQKLLDPNFLTMKDAELFAGYNSGKYPLVREQPTFGLSQLNPKNDPAIDVKAIMPFKIDGYMPSIPRSDHFNIGYRSPVVISKKSKYIDDIIRAMDYTYSDEGVEFFLMGKEGETFTRDAKTPSGYRLDKVQSVWTMDASGNYPAGMKKLQDSGYYTVWLTGIFPAFHRFNLVNFKEGEQERALFDINNLKKLDEIGFLQSDPVLLWTKDENSKKAEISTPLNTYISENAIKFILGQKPMSDWDSFIAGVKKLRSDELVKIFNDKLAKSK